MYLLQAVDVCWVLACAPSVTGAAAEELALVLGQGGDSEAALGAPPGCGAAASATALFSPRPQETRPCFVGVL